MTDIHSESAFQTTITTHLTKNDYNEGSPDDFDQDLGTCKPDLA